MGAALYNRRARLQPLIRRGCSLFSVLRGELEEESEDFADLLHGPAPAADAAGARAARAAALTGRAAAAAGGGGGGRLAGAAPARARPRPRRLEEPEPEPEPEGDEERRSPGGTVLVATSSPERGMTPEGALKGLVVGLP